MTPALMLAAFAAGVVLGMVAVIQVIALHDGPVDDWICAE